MDDNELENERDKREHELALVLASRPRNDMAAFWDLLNEHFLLLIGTILAIAIMYSK